MKKYTTYLVESILVIGIVIFIFCNYDLYEQSKLSDRPFDPNVWGTVSDWCLVIVTALTAIYLIKTFKAQQKNRLIELMPNFELVLENDRYMIRLSNATAFNIRVFYHVKEKQVAKSISVWHTYHNPVYAHSVPESNIGDNLKKYSTIFFEDGDENSYTQTIYHTEKVLIIHPPKIKQ